MERLFTRRQVFEGGLAVVVALAVGGLTALCSRMDEDERLISTSSRRETQGGSDAIVNPVNNTVKVAPSESELQGLPVIVR